MKEEFAVVATSRRLASDSGAFADWVASSSAGDLSLGFNAAPTAGGGGNTGGGGGGMWSSSTRQVNYGLPPEMGMVGLRDVFVVAPASSFHHNNQHQEPLNFDHSITPSNANTALGVGVGVIPLLTANMGVDEDVLNRNRSIGIQLWQNQPTQHSNYLKKPMMLDHSNAANLMQSSGGGGGGSGIGGSGSVATCQDCGNQAKKDCSHRRCRTCCKSRGFDCATHVKSTWVPAARRRERQLMTSAAAAAGSSGSTSGAKKPRLITSQTTTTSHTSTSNTTPPRSYDTSSSHQDASFKDSLPGQIRAPAVFKCVRVTAVDDGDDEYAYQAVVKIGGHVFKGFLYDQGVESRDGFPNISELHLGGGGGNGGGRNGASSSSPILDPSDVYGASTAGLIGGSNYGNPIN
ncbi:unnamed protein product [Ilex paraguariensis]|uniref:Uncharacterized protein n=2 Tax=Ilex paraguariensis TaxID=185542 RepID=A0ABC8UTN8_9AQUA